MRTTSAARATASRTASSPSAAVADDLDAGQQARGASPAPRAPPAGRRRAARGSGQPPLRLPSGMNSSTRKPVVRRRSSEAPAEQLRALTHAGEPVAQAGLALTLDGPGVTVGADVLHDEARAVGLVAQAQVDVGRARVTAHVRQRLLRRAVHGQARLGAELARPAVEARASQSMSVCSRNASASAGRRSGPGMVSPRSASIARRASSRPARARPWLRSIASVTSGSAFRASVRAAARPRAAR